MSLLKFTLHADSNTEFAPGAFDDEVGQQLPGPAFDGRGVIEAAKVSDDGRSVRFMVRLGQ